jgi:hypothetical protein
MGRIQLRVGSSGASLLDQVASGGGRMDILQNLASPLPVPVIEHSSEYVIEAVPLQQCYVSTTEMIYKLRLKPEISV